MEWISFTLNSEKKELFETTLMPSICKRYASLIEMAGHTWSAYYNRNGLDSFQYVFCSDSPVLNKFVKEFAGNTTRLFTTPDVSHMETYGPENLV